MSSASARMSLDETEAYSLASPYLARTDHRTTLGTAPLRGMRWSAALGQAMAGGRLARQAGWAQWVIRHLQGTPIPVALS